MTWIQIHFFPVGIQDPYPDPDQNWTDPKHWGKDLKITVVNKTFHLKQRPQYL